MLFARDKSQMCNNLLQFAHVYAWGREHGRHTISMRFSYKYPYFHIRNTKHCSFFWYLVAKYLSALRILPTASFKRKGCDRKSLEQKMLRNKHIVVSGWEVRFYDLFLKYREEITKLFTFNDDIYDKVKRFMSEKGHEGALRLGIHIRRGDYKEWANGRYFYSDDVYIEYIQEFLSKHPTEKADIYICSNDPALNLDYFRSQLSNDAINMLGGNPAEDLCLLSECDYLIGPPSTFSLVASMYRDIPLCWMDTSEASDMKFEKFENLFCNLR